MDHFLQEENKGQNRPLEPVRVARQRERYIDFEVFAYK